MYEASYDTLKNYKTFLKMINDNGWSTEDVLIYLTDWYGLSLMSEEFIQNLIDCEL